MLKRMLEMAEDAPNHLRVFDERDQLEKIPATRTREHVEAEAPLHQLGPQPIRARRRRRVSRAPARTDWCLGLSRPRA